MNFSAGFFRLILCVCFGLLNLTGEVAFSKTFAFHDDQLWLDGQAQPQIFGAEIQYFRLRGGNGPNIPREKVIALWNQALDRAVEAGMNTVSFYTPWDFHEYAEGRFDFDGTSDEDGDGNPDYPSRDLHTFIKLIQQHGIHNIVVRPGPYINAEWGFLGFGAVPLWFHKKYPNSHAQNSLGQRTPLYSYADPDFLRLSRVWLETIYAQVFKENIGPGKPISFIQVDNETNFQWQSIYNHDYSPRVIEQYQNFLKNNYSSLERLNAVHGRSWKSWTQVYPATQPGRNLAEDQDWYRFSDYSLFIYLKNIRQIWTDLGVTEPTVLFTLAESYNAAENGLLPNYALRNSHSTGMMTVNLYPKTYETNENPLLNLPFKADHDVKAADAATDIYIGHPEAWVMGPEIQGGWWRGIDVSEKARQQTYLSTLGHGLKALFVYYFHEGNNWQADWMKTAITPYFNAIKNKPEYQNIAEKDLPPNFWQELDRRVAVQFMVVNAQYIWQSGGSQPPTLYFDAPLDGNANARAPFELLKQIGKQIVIPYGTFLGQAHELEDSVCVIKDSAAHVPTNIPGIQSRIVQSDWMGGLLGLLMQVGVNPRIHHWNLNPKADLLNTEKCKLIVYQDTGLTSPELIKTLLQAVDQGSSVLTFISSNVADTIKSLRPANSCTEIPTSPMNVLGYQCKMGAGSIYFAKIPIYDVYNTDFLFLVHDAVARGQVIQRILTEVGIQPQVKIKNGGDRTVTFARTNPNGDELWITAKTLKHEGFTGSIQWTKADQNKKYQVHKIMSGEEFEITGQRLSNDGFDFTLSDSGSEAYYIKAKN